MQRSWGQFAAYEPQTRAAPAKFSEDDVAVFLEEVAAARDREAYLRVVAKFDAQFLAKYKARFPSATGKFPFGSAGKPYTYGAPQPSGFFDRPTSAVTSQVQTERYRPEPYQMYQPPQYRVQTPAPMLPSFPVRTEQPYSTPIYERPGEYRPQSSYVERSFGERPAESFPRPAEKTPFNSLSDYAELRKSKEEVLTRFQQGGQRPPKA